MEDFVSFFLVLITITIFYIYLETKALNVTYVVSTIDNHKYLVRNEPDKVEAANLLATMKERLSRLVLYAKEYKPKEKNETRRTDIDRLVKNWRPDNISESSPNNKFTSYSINKGEKIVFCIRSKDSSKKLVPINTMMFVAIHELGHLMTESIGHTPEFWDNMKYLLERALEMPDPVYTKQNFSSNPVSYCGTEITSTPLN